MEYLRTDPAGTRTPVVSLGERMKSMEELLHAFEGKLEAVRTMIDEYDEAMDYASHCALQGFAEGLAFAIEETRNRLDGEENAKS
jgi:hypothetical protein